jgi:hypothetical protein
MNTIHTTGALEIEFEGVTYTRRYLTDTLIEERWNTRELMDMLTTSLLLAVYLGLLGYYNIREEQENRQASGGFNYVSEPDTDECLPCQ